MPNDAFFRPDLFEFLRELKRHNNRDWFARNKARYEADQQTKGPAPTGRLGQGCRFLTRNEDSPAGPFAAAAESLLSHSKTRNYPAMSGHYFILIFLIRLQVCA